MHRKISKKNWIQHNRTVTGFPEYTGRSEKKGGGGGFRPQKIIFDAEALKKFYLERFLL